MMESFDSVLHLPRQIVSAGRATVTRFDHTRDHTALSPVQHFHTPTSNTAKPAKSSSLRLFKRKMYSMFARLQSQSQCPVEPLPLEFTVLYSADLPVYNVDRIIASKPRKLKLKKKESLSEHYLRNMPPPKTPEAEENPRSILYPTSTSIGNWKKILTGKSVYLLKLSNGSEVHVSEYKEFARLVQLHNLTNPRLLITGLVCGGGKPKRRKRRNKRPQQKVSTSVVKTSGNLNVGRSLPPQTARNVWTYISNVSSDAAGKFSFFTNIRNPAKAINGSGQFVRAVEDAKIWDGYFIQSYTIQMVPIFPTTVTSGLVVAAVDQEGTSPTSTPSYDTLIDRRYRSMFFGRQARTFTIRPKPLTSGTFEGRVCPIIELGRKVFYDYEFPPDQGIFEVAGENFAPNSALYQIFLYMNVINYSPRTLPGLAPRVSIATGPGGTIVPNPTPLAPLRRPRSRSL